MLKPPNTGKDVEQWGLSFIADKNANDTAALEDSLAAYRLVSVYIIVSLALCICQNT